MVSTRGLNGCGKATLPLLVFSWPTPQLRSQREQLSPLQRYPSLHVHSASLVEEHSFKYLNLPRKWKRVAVQVRAQHAAQQRLGTFARTQVRLVTSARSPAAAPHCSASAASTRGAVTDSRSVCHPGRGNKGPRSRRLYLRTCGRACSRGVRPRWRRCRAGSAGSARSPRPARRYLRAETRVAAAGPRCRGAAPAVPRPGPALTRGAVGAARRGGRGPRAQRQRQQSRRQKRPRRPRCRCSHGLGAGVRAGRQAPTLRGRPRRSWCVSRGRWGNSGPAGLSGPPGATPSSAGQRLQPCQRCPAAAAAAPGAPR